MPSKELANLLQDQMKAVRQKAQKRLYKLSDRLAGWPTRQRRGILISDQTSTATAIAAKEYIIQAFWMFQKISRFGSIMIYYLFLATIAIQSPPSLYGVPERLFQARMNWKPAFSSTDLMDSKV